MKRIFSFICACLLLCTCALTCFADETIESQPSTIPSEPNTNENAGPSADDVSWMIAQNIPMDDTTVPAPSIQVDTTTENLRILCTTYPDEATAFVLHDLGQQYGEGYMPTQWTTSYMLDWRFDDNAWFSECAELDDALTDVLCNSMYFETPVTQTMQFYLFDLNNYTPEQYETNCLADIVEKQGDGYYIDFAKHRLEVRVIIKFNMYEGAIQLPTSRPTAYFTLQHDTPLPSPTIDHATINPNTNTLSFRLASDSVVQLLMQNSRALNLCVKYSINDKEYSPLLLSVNPDKYYTHTLEDIQVTPEDVVKLHVAYQDPNTEVMSEWKIIDVTYTEKQSVSAIIQPGDTDVQYETTTECTVCHHCATPFNMCLYLLIAIIIGACGTITCIIWIILTHTKEKQTCQNKNSKTPK